MKILHLIDSGGLYGAEKMLLTLVKAQIRQGLKPMILSACLPGGETKALDKEAEFFELPLIQWKMSEGLNFKSAFQIANWAKENQFDLLHSHGYKFDILLGLMPKYLRRLPVLATSHGYTHQKLISKLGVYSIVDRLSLFFVETAITVSASQKILKFGPFWRKRSVIENGIEIKSDHRNIDGFDSHDFFETKNKVLRLCAIGRLSEEKGFNLLIKAVDQLLKNGHEIHLSIAGEGPERKYLEDQVKTQNITESVDFLGYVSNVSELFDRSDLFVISSHSEGLPVTLLEAMESRIPIMATRVGAIPIVLEDEVSGILVSPSDVKELVRGIERFSILSSDAIESLTGNADKKLRSNYSAEIMCEKYLQAYKKLINYV